MTKRELPDWFKNLDQKKYYFISEVRMNFDFLDNKNPQVLYELVERTARRYGCSVRTLTEYTAVPNGPITGQYIETSNGIVFTFEYFDIDKNWDCTIRVANMALSDDPKAREKERSEMRARVINKHILTDFR